VQQSRVRPRCRLPMPGLTMIRPAPPHQRQAGLDPFARERRASLISGDTAHDSEAPNLPNRNRARSCQIVLTDDMMNREWMTGATADHSLGGRRRKSDRRPHIIEI